MRSDYSDYQRYISSKEWRVKRQKRLAIDGNECQTCGHDGSIYQLEIHHKHYRSFMEEDVERDLITLCSQCHEAITASIRGRRYEGIEIETEFLTTTANTRKDCDGLEDDQISIDWRLSDVDAQRAARKPFVCIVKSVEACHIQTRKDRR